MNSARLSKLLLPIVIGLSVCLLLVDIKTPLGTAEWILYLAPVSLCLFSDRPWHPLAVATFSAALMVVGMLYSPPSASVPFALAALNRSIGGVTLALLAAIGYVFIRARNETRRLTWLHEAAGTVGAEMLGHPTAQAVADRALAILVRLSAAQAGVLYHCEESGRLRRLATWGQLGEAAPAELAAANGGLAGQAARERRIIEIAGASGASVSIGSTLAPRPVLGVIAAPMTAEGQVNAVVELGFTTPLDPSITEMMQRCAEIIGMALRSSLYRDRLEHLLRQTQQQKEELQAQQEELTSSNEELEEQSRRLRDSQARLELQQTELEETNTRLEEQQHALLEARDRLGDNARSLERANRYKSEFLANMSHELRTPLNSSLILAKLLSDNKAGTLTAEQVRYAQTIQSSNHELLTLINEILDLSKIEAGRVEIAPVTIGLRGMLEALEAAFRPMAEQKGLRLKVALEPGAPESIVSDPQRLQQVLKNLVSNALKFTEQGEVRIAVRADGARVRFDVSDTGIGIAPEQHEVIFEAFRQADGTTSRKYGGTGLGLSISRELARLLSGTLELRSELGRGSTFSLRLPAAISAPASMAPVAQPPVSAGIEDGVPERTLPDDRDRRAHPGRLILIVEDDPVFSGILYDLVHDLGFDALRATTAAEAVTLARRFQPSAVLLDAHLPDDSGLTVLERLKRDSATRHVPIHVVSAHDYTETALQLGAIGYTLKPTSREELERAMRAIEERLRRSLRQLLIIEDDSALRRTLTALLSDRSVEIDAVGTVREAREKLASKSFDCVVMDLHLSDGSGFELLESMAAGGRYAFPPVIVYTGQSLDADDEQRLRRYSKSIIVKGARSPERLLDEVTLFLHSVESDLPPERQRALREMRERDGAFEGRRVLIAEDDVRNVFALSQVLEPLGAKVEIARNGREALAALERNSCDLVLMDIMMPEMDGLTAIRELRGRPAHARLPVIALTAKAMPEDRARCLEAGASDYIAKPIDVDKLLSLCRVWMPR